jgi:hypothetical protein
MIYLDSVLLDLVERSCRRLQMLTGRTNVWLAFQLTNLSIIFYFVWAGEYFLASEGLPRIGVAVFGGGVLFILSQTVFKVPLETLESGAYRRVARGFRNPRRARDVLLRITFLTMTMLLFVPIVFLSLNYGQRIAALIYSILVLTTVVLYLLACDPLAPCAGTLKEWLRGLVPARLAPARDA